MALCDVVEGGNGGKIATVMTRRSWLWSRRRQGNNEIGTVSAMICSGDEYETMGDAIGGGNWWRWITKESGESESDCCCCWWLRKGDRSVGVVC